MNDCITPLAFDALPADLQTQLRPTVERLGYFAADPDVPMLFHRTVGLRDEWANLVKRKQQLGGR